MPRYTSAWEYGSKSKGMMYFLMIGAAVCIVIAFFQVWFAYRDVDALKYRVQISVDAEKMADRLEELRINMEKYSLTSGYVFPLFGTPAGDLALDYEAVIDARDRALLLAEQDHASTQYQSGMDDLRGTVREIEIEAGMAKFWRSIYTYIALLAISVAILYLFM